MQGSIILNFNNSGCYNGKTTKLDLILLMMDETFLNINKIIILSAVNLQLTNITYLYL